jgi:hypothetical protein
MEQKMIYTPINKYLSFMIKPEWTFMNDNKATAWECVCGALNAMSNDKCGKCGKNKKVKKYY